MDDSLRTGQDPVTTMTHSTQPDLSQSRPCPSVIHNLQVQFMNLSSLNGELRFSTWMMSAWVNEYIYYGNTVTVVLVVV